MKPYRMLCLLLGLLLCATFLITLVLTADAAESSAYTDEECIECHRAGSEESDLTIDVKAYQASVHVKELGCQECHTQVIDDSHQETEGSRAVDCGQCHEQERKHGPPDEPLDCHACHPQHAMRPKDDPASSVHADQLAVTCGGCHPAATGRSGYFTWFPAWQIASHNKGDFANAYDKTRCLDCHQGAGAHGESQPVNDQTCYKCHFKAGAAGAMWGKMHPDADRDSQPLIFAAAAIYQVVIAGGLLVLVFQIFMVGHRARARATGSNDLNTKTKT